MIENISNGLSYYTFENLSGFDEISHGVFTRKGGVSEGAFSGLNIGIVPGDSESNVFDNRNMILNEIGGGKFVSAKQVHGTDVMVSNGAIKEVVEADAVVSDKRGEVLLIKTADCQSVLLFDSKKRAVANIHSGWRGSISNIIGETVEVMKREYGTDPVDITAGIGPSLGPCCAEFKNYKDEIPEKYWKYQVSDNHFDFWKISSDQLADTGVPKENIETSGICTKCNPDLFYSYRYSNITGRFGTVIMLKDDK